MTDLERLARVAAQVDTGRAHPNEVERCKSIVRAILTAMREPSEELIRAMDPIPHGAPPGYTTGNEDTFCNAFTAAIDHVLNEEP